MISTITFLAAYGISQGPPVTIEVPLRRVRIEQYIGQSFYEIKKGTPYLRGYKIPASMGVTHSALMYLDNHELAIVASEDEGKKRFSKIWVDFNRSKKFEVAEVADYAGPDKTRQSVESYIFKAPPKVGSKLIDVRIIGSKTRMIAIAPTVSMQGTFRIGNEPISVEIFDTDFNGFYGNASKYGGDSMFISMSSKGFGCAVGQLIPLSDERFYTIKPTQDDSKVVFLRDETPIGTLSISNLNSPYLVLKCSNGSITAQPQNGETKVPALDYSLSYTSANIASKSGKNYSVSFASQPKTTFHVKADGKTELQLGDGAKLALSVAGTGRTKSFNLNLTDKNQFRVSGLYEKSGNDLKHPKEPELIIYGPDKSIVYKRTFEYG